MSPPKEKILVVEDDYDALDLMAKQALAPMGYLVATATDGAAGIQRAIQLQPDLVIASLQLPGLSGKDLMVAIRSQGLDAPVIVTATHGMEAQAIAAFRLGAVDFLAKPLREAELVSAVDRALAQVRLRRERAQLADSLGQANKQLERRVKELTVLYGIGKAVTSSTDIQQLFGRLVEAALFVTEAELGYVLLVDEESGKFVMRASKNMPPSASGTRLLGGSFDDGVSSLVLKSGEPLTIAGAALGKFKIANLAQAAAVVPMKAKEKVVGVIVVANKSARPFGDRDQAMLSAVADYASIALVNARLFHELEARANSLQQAYDEIRAGEKVKTDIVQNVSHELRTPLIHARGYADLLAQSDTSRFTPEQLEAVQTITAKLDAIARLIENLTALSDTGGRPEAPETIPVTDLARQAVSRFELAAKSAGIALVSQLRADGAKVVVDVTGIARVFDEYLSNAIKFSPQGGQVTLRVRDVGDGTVEVMVADSGIGIPPDKLPRVFDRFYQVDSSTTRKFGGAGLGLSLVKQIVEAQGGKVWAESEGVPGKGSRFYFTVLKAQD
ncbi:MAG: response regulator [Chloroflexi bacterium]|nr:response regulator [Chloroflexota bacterium]